MSSHIYRMFRVAWQSISTFAMHAWAERVRIGLQGKDDGQLRLSFGPGKHCYPCMHCLGTWAQFSSECIGGHNTCYAKLPQGPAPSSIQGVPLSTPRPLRCRSNMSWMTMAGPTAFRINPRVNPSSQGMLNM